MVELAEERKCVKYISLPVTHSFILVAIETYEGLMSLEFLKGELDGRGELRVEYLSAHAKKLVVARGS